MSERERIVAYINREAGKYRGKEPIGEIPNAAWAAYMAVRRIARGIERLEHLKRPEPTIPAE